MVKLPSSSSSSSSSSDSSILPAKPLTRSKKRLLPKNAGWFEKSYSEPHRPNTSKTNFNNVWQLFSESSPKKSNRRQKKKQVEKKKVPATVTRPTEIVEEEMEDLILEDDIEVMRDVSGATFSSPKRSVKFSKFLQKFNRSSRIRKEFKSPRPVKRKRVPSDHRPIPELDDLEYDVFEDTDSSECLKVAETATTTGVSIQYENLPKYLHDSPSIPVGLSRKFHNSTAVDGHQNNLLELTQDISVITSGSSKQTFEETTPSRFPALHSGNKRRKKSCNIIEEKKKPVSSTRLFQTNNSDLSIPDLSPIIQLTGRQSIKNKSKNKRKCSTENCSEDVGEVIENPPSPLSLIKIIVDKTLVNKQSTFRQGDGIHPMAEFGISSIKNDDDDDDFLQPKPDTRYIDSKDFYQTYDVEEIEVPDVICIDDEDKDVFSMKTSMKDGNNSKNKISFKENGDLTTMKYNTNDNSISGKGSAIVEKLLSRKSSKLSKTAQTILEVSSPGPGSIHIKDQGSSFVEKPCKVNSSKLSKTAKTILEVASPVIRNNISGEGSTLFSKGNISKLSKTAQTILEVSSPGFINNNSHEDSTLVAKPSNFSKLSKTAQTMLGVVSPVIGDLTKNMFMASKSNPSSVSSSKHHNRSLETNKPAANTIRTDNICNMKQATVKSRRQSTSKAVNISICCLQNLTFPPPMKVLIRQKTIPNGKRFNTELQTAAEDILGKAVPLPKGISKECRKKKSMYYFKDVKRYGRGK
ncbi:hypothetical protein LOTGIDRAFT_238028 [Lottia gigantea]|uniref:Uncharacterized protein n=1 Tax=Lottia gigantea TaxID=225164 RepID=V4B4A6_LOTGI|nr:hypothetical protein LOTGIDRAFT_238028 [Lottia gigantea]ESP02301.1 hypothetical protein LOTGIDRAFT_238028 [Lottia gigantea]